MARRPEDSDLVAQVAFRPQRCAPSKGPWLDSSYASGELRLAYRLYKNPEPAAGALLVYFHANAELCTDLEALRGCATCRIRGRARCRSSSTAASRRCCARRRLSSH